MLGTLDWWVKMQASLAPVYFVSCCLSFFCNEWNSKNSRLLTEAISTVLVLEVSTLKTETALLNFSPWLSLPLWVKLKAEATISSKFHARRFLLGWRCLMMSLVTLTIGRASDTMQASPSSRPDNSDWEKGISQSFLEELRLEFSLLLSQAYAFCRTSSFGLPSLAFIRSALSKIYRSNPEEPARVYIIPLLDLLYYKRRARGDPAHPSSTTWWLWRRADMWVSCVGKRSPGRLWSQRPRH